MTILVDMDDMIEPASVSVDTIKQMKNTEGMRRLMISADPYG